nr:unnamed protein product [Callosobruchus chinensis]
MQSREGQFDSSVTHP